MNVIKLSPEAKKLVIYSFLLFVCFFGVRFLWNVVSDGFEDIKKQNLLFYQERKEALEQIKPKFFTGQIVKSVVSNQKGQILEIQKNVITKNCQYQVRFDSRISERIWMEEIELAAEGE